MSYALSIADYITPLPAIDLAKSLSEIAPAIEAAERETEAQRRRFEDLCRIAEELAPDELREAADRLAEIERTAAAVLLPIAKDADARIRHYRGRAHTASQKVIVRLLQRSQDVAVQRLEQLQDVGIRLRLLASEKMKAAGQPSVEIGNDEDLDQYFRAISE
jgi:hypothetical protein